MTSSKLRWHAFAICIVSILIAVPGCGKAEKLRLPEDETSKAAKGTEDENQPSAWASKKREPYLQELPGTREKIYMVPVPDGKGGGFWMSSKEVTWDVYDHFIYGIGAEKDVETARTGDVKAAENPDALTRPSKPYVHPDRGYGHEGYAVISCSSKNAECFGIWFSEKTGRKYRLPTEDEWERACLGDGPPPNGLKPGEKLADFAWYAENSNDKTQPVGSKRPNSFGLHDMLGNASEWVRGRDGDFVQKGGSFWDDADQLVITTREKYDRMWQMTDPQLPKSQWWLSDAPFAGLRIVRDFD